MGWGNAAPTAKCNAGFYCPYGQSRPDPPLYDCWKAYYCEAGATSPKPCPSGTYQNEVQQSNCKVRSVRRIALLVGLITHSTNETMNE